MGETLDLLLAVPFWVAVLRIATPLLLGTLGVLLCERAGVLNLGIEGIMVAGAFAGWLTVYQGGGLWAGVAVAALTGMVFGALHAALTVSLGLSQHVSGLGITLLATSLASYAYRVSFPKVDSPPTIQPFADMSGWLPLPVLNQQTPLTLLALLLVPALAWLLYRTPLGLALRMVGENPEAVEGQGLQRGAPAHRRGDRRLGADGRGRRFPHAWPRSTRSTSTWSTAAAGSAWRWWCLRRGGRDARCCGALLFGFFDALQLRLQQAGCGAVRAAGAVPVLPDAAVRDGDRRAAGGGAARQLPAGADEAVAQGPALRPRARRPGRRPRRTPCRCADGNGMLRLFGQAERRMASEPRHIRLTSHPGQQGPGSAPAIHWGAADALERGPIVGTTGNRSQRNVIGTHSGSYGVYRALAVAAGNLTRGHRADLTNTAPTDLIGPYEQWGDAKKIVSIDPWGASVQAAFADYIAQGYDIRPTIAVTKAHIHLPEIKQAIAFQRLAIDGTVLLDDASAAVTKIAIEPVWWLPGVAERFKRQRGRPAARAVRGDRRHVPRAGDAQRPRGVPAADRRPDAVRVRRRARPGQPGDHADRARARRVQRFGRVRLRHLHLPAVSDACHRRMHPGRAARRRRASSPTAARKAARSAR